jgi:hypothetical protein
MSFLNRQQVLPESQQQRFGKTLVLDMMYYDHLLYGAAQDLSAENQLFTSSTRIRNDNLCNLKEIGRFSDGKQFAAYCIGVQLWSTSSMSFYEQMVYHSRIHIKYQDAEKQIIWLDQAPAGGGLYGFDNNTSAFVVSNGVPSRGNQWLFTDPLVIVPGKTFELTHKFQSGRSGGTDPLTAINADDADRTFRVYLRGLEGRDPENG